MSWVRRSRSTSAEIGLEERSERSGGAAHGVDGSLRLQRDTGSLVVEHLWVAEQVRDGRAQLMVDHLQEPLAQLGLSHVGGALTGDVLDEHDGPGGSCRSGLIKSEALQHT